MHWQYIACIQTILTYNTWCVSVCERKGGVSVRRWTCVSVCVSKRMDISWGVICEAASRVIPLLCGAVLPWGLQQRELQYVVLWKQERRLCVWMAVLALYERSLARSQDPAPREGRLMTASHGKALQQQRGKGRNRVGDGRWREGGVQRWSGSDRNRYE